jgi:hypothetical protein
MAADLTIGSWQVTGSQMWRTTFPTTALSSGTDEGGASELRYPQSGRYLTVNYEQAMSKNRTLRIEAGVMGSIQSGTGSDSDWNYSLYGNDLWYYGEFASTGRSMFATIDWVQKVDKNNERFWGYSYRDNSFIMTDGVYYRWENQDIAPLHLSDLHSTYKMIYQGPHMGWRYTAALSRKWLATGMLSYAPIAYVRGHGWWNLRDLPFSHNGPGQMLDVSLGIKYNLTAQTAITAGYRYQYHGLFHGWEDTDKDIRWEKATNIQKGFYLGGEMRF